MLAGNHDGTALHDGPGSLRDTLRVSVDDTMRQAREAISSAGKTATNAVLSAAVRYRKERRERR